MLQEIFYWIFNMSITAAITGVLIMLVRLIKKIPRRMTVFLWIIPFLRMTFPFGLNSPYSMIRTRIENILSFKKLTWLSLTIFVALIGVIFYVLLTNAG